MGDVKLELIRAKNYTLIESEGPRKGRAITFRGDRTYEVNEAQAEILLAKIDPMGGDVFRIVLDEPEVAEEDEGPKVSLVEKKKREAAAKKTTVKAKKTRKKKTKGKKLSEVGDVDNIKSTAKPKASEPEVTDPVDGENPDEGIPDELLQV